jgi:hypothetical protein
MFDWLFYLLAPVMPDAAPQKDYIGVVAAEAAYAALLPDKEVAPKPLVDPKDCNRCNGTGRVRTGDGQGWMKCPDCQPMAAAFSLSPLPEVPELPATESVKTSEVKVPKSDPARYIPSSPK